jgi:Ca-activated chloride channel homolog
VIGFAHPVLLLGLAVPAALALWNRRVRRNGSRCVDVPVLPPSRSTTLRQRLAFLPPLLQYAGAAAAVVALAGPQTQVVRPRHGVPGLDIAVAIDVSSSMAAEDFLPDNRLKVARRVVARFIEQRLTDRIALVAFAGGAVTISPATQDTATLLTMLGQAQLNRLPDGTAIGNALATCVSRLKDLPGPGKVIVLVTDGGNNAGQIDPATAADLARAYGIRVYTIGVGRNGRVPIPVRVQDPLTGETETRRVMAQVNVDEGLLRAIARATGGQFFRAMDPNSLQSIFREIDRLEKSPSAPQLEIVAKPWSPQVTAAAAIVFLLAVGLACGPLRVATDIA